MAQWSCPAQPRWRPSRALVRTLVRHRIEALPDDPAPASVDVLVVLSPLPGPRELLDQAGWRSLRPGGLLVDLATPPRRRVSELLRPWIHPQRSREAAAQRVRHWLEKGAYSPEQWVPVEPADVLLTIVRRAVRSGGLMGS